MYSTTKNILNAQKEAKTTYVCNFGLFLAQIWSLNCFFKYLFQAAVRDHWEKKKVYKGRDYAPSDSGFQYLLVWDHHLSVQKYIHKHIMYTHWQQKQNKYPSLQFPWSALITGKHKVKLHYKLVIHVLKLPHGNNSQKQSFSRNINQVTVRHI